MKRVLTIAGSDSGGGAGIQADLKTFTVLGQYGLSVVTALTAQNTVGVEAVQLAEPDFVAAQLDAVMSDIGADGAKCGMLATAEIIEVVAAKVEEWKIAPLVLDPVMVAKSGHSLIDDSAKEVLKEKLLPLATLVTPNLPEAEDLTGVDCSTEDGREKAAARLQEMGCPNVLIKGGHAEGEPIDLLITPNGGRSYPGVRIETPNTHGTGCTISAALAAFLAQGVSMEEAVGRAKRFITRAIAQSISLGSGHGPTNHLAHLTDELARGEVLEAMNRVGKRLAKLDAAGLVPEICAQIAYALPGAESFEEVAAFPGRIVKMNGQAIPVGCPEFGGSRHTAKVVLAARRFDKSIRAAMPIFFSEEIVKICRDLGYKVGSFDRTEEPKEVKELEGSSLEWGTGRAFEDFGVCDVVFDRGDVGKEPIIRLLGKSPDQILEMASAILERLS